MRRRASYYLAKMDSLPASQVDINGARITTCPGVFNPTASTSTAQICRWIAKQTAPASLLDLGTGTGAIGIVAAQTGCPAVLMTDCNARAVECAKANVASNGVASRCSVELHLGTKDLVGPFHTILFAAPYLWFGATPRLRQRFGSLVDSMFDENDAAKRSLFEDALRILAPGGSLVLQIGSISRHNEIMTFASAAGFELHTTETAPDGQEQHMILEFKHSLVGSRALRANDRI